MIFDRKKFLDNAVVGMMLKSREIGVQMLASDCEKLIEAMLNSHDLCDQIAQAICEANQMSDALDEARKVDPAVLNQPIVASSTLQYESADEQWIIGKECLTGEGLHSGKPPIVIGLLFDGDKLPLFKSFDEAVAEIKKRELPIGWVAIEINRLTSTKLYTEPQLPPDAEKRIAELVDKATKYDAINTPEIEEFLTAVHNEALHQRERWGSEHDAGKTDADWFWLVGFLAGKAIRPDNTPEKQLHHIITTAAALLNWHAAKVGTHTLMRPGIGPDAQPPKPSEPLEKAA